MTSTFQLKSRLRAAGIHLGSSLLVAAAASLLVFKLWYPWPFAALAGGTHLFLLLVSVDVIMGPALTAVVVSPGKLRRELVRDLAIIVVLQLAAFGYGLYTMALARPVAVVYEIDLLRVLAAVDIEPDSLSQAPPALRALPWTGPRLLAAVKPADPAEQARSIEQSMAGLPLAAQTQHWRSYGDHAQAAWRAARPVSVLVAKYPAVISDLARLAAQASQSVDALRFLPVQARNGSGVAMLSPSGAEVLGYLPVDGFF